MAFQPKRLRRQPGAKKVDLTDLRHLMRDGLQWTALAVVVEPDDSTPHYELEFEDGVLVDVFVHVETVPDELELECRLAGMSGSQGMIEIPALGDEVVVVIPAGRIDFMPIIVAKLSSHSISNPSSQGPAVNRLVIANTEVLVHDGAGGAQELATKADLEAHKAWSDAHRHDAPQASAGSLPTSTPTTSTAGARIGGADDSPAGVYTTVLKAK